MKYLKDLTKPLHQKIRFTINKLKNRLTIVLFKIDGETPQLVIENPQDNLFCKVSSANTLVEHILLTQNLVPLPPSKIV